MIIRIDGNESNVQRMLQDVINSNNGVRIRVEYYNDQVFEGSIHSFTYNHPISNLSPITALSIYINDTPVDLDIKQIKVIMSI